MSESCILKIQSFGSFCLKPNAIVRHAEQFGYTGPNRGCMRPNLRSRQNQTGIDVADFIFRIPHSIECIAQENRRICALPLRIRRREESADIWSSDCAQQGIRDGVQKNVAVGVATQTLVVRKGDPANLQRHASTELVGIEAVANAGRWSSVVGRWHSGPGGSIREIRENPWCWS